MVCVDPYHVSYAGQIFVECSEQCCYSGISKFDNDSLFPDWNLNQTGILNQPE